MIKVPMTREEALLILNIQPPTDPAEEYDPTKDYKKVMERFETLFEKNQPDKGGSFYIQSKLYFAKEFLMQDFPIEYNKSQYNPGSSTQ